MTREVKKPKALRIGERQFRVVAWMGTKHAVVVDGMPLVVKPEQARRLARWLDDYAAWAKSLEPEFDERNE